MKTASLHPWGVTAKEGLAVQRRLTGRVSLTNSLGEVRWVAGVDVSISRSQGAGRAAVVVLSYPELALAEVKTVEGEITFPYVPGLLSFREAPLALAAFEGLEIVPDLVIVDGQGLAHPRRLGLASHLGLFLDLPTIGCAKSRLCGEHDPVDSQAGSQAILWVGQDAIGAVVRTRTDVKPVYVSVGHKVDLASAVAWVLACCRGYRLPETTRFAHRAAGGNLTHRPKTGKQQVLL